MEVKAKLRHLRMSPQKVRLVADMIRGRQLDDALNAMMLSDKKAAKSMAGLLKSAAANAGNVEGMDTMSLYVSSVQVDEGPTWKRFMPRAMGRASAIFKRSCHISLTLADSTKNADKASEDVAEEKEAVKEKTSAKKSTSKKDADEKKAENAEVEVKEETKTGDSQE